MEEHETVPTSEEELLPAKSSSITITIEELAKVVSVINGVAPVAPAPPSGLGNPGPLGLGSFATTTFALSVYNAGVFMDKTSEPMVFGLAMAFGGIAQFIAGLYEYKIPNTFGATAFCGYGAFWVSFAIINWFLVPTIPADQKRWYMGLYLLVWTIFTSYLTVAAFKVSRVVSIIFMFLIVTFILLTAGAFSENHEVTQAGGFFGLACAAVAYYGSAAVVINSTWNRTILPVGVIPPGKIW
eukprot:TRINITY_DN3747_c0_g1_i2.p1 TRINITY_DN3747_c0_g1~~TRINITY_DN3747_c0_g1_i2.p1  ORF type:complete len:241 (-),score=22.65 TRINITY_DN3747_c0_g1_i2:52-774(-)